MSSEMRCEDVRELAPEVALDIASGQERDAVLRHLTSCTACRRQVFELSSVRDSLLLLMAPAIEPPGGFEGRVLEALAEQTEHVKPMRSRRRSWVTATVAAAVVVAAAVLGGVSTFLATAADRQLGEVYRATLETGQGSFFAAAALEGSRGRVGTVFGYQGEPSWVVVTLDSVSGKESYDLEVRTRSGGYMVVAVADFGGDRKVWSTELPVDFTEVLGLRFIAPDGGTAFVATFETADPWK